MYVNDDIEFYFEFEILLSNFYGISITIIDIVVEY